MKLFKLRGLMLLFFITQVTFAQSRFGIIGLQNKTRFEAAGAKSEWGSSLGYGLTWELPTPEGSGWELGVSSFSRSWDAQSEYPNISVPLLHNIWLGSYLGLGLGGYFSKATKNIILSGTEMTFETAQMRSTDFGLLGAVKVNLPFEIRGLSLMIEGRYHYGLANVSRQSGLKSRFEDFQILVGFKFGTLGAKVSQSKDEKK